jgi:hypothetical protein
MCPADTTESTERSSYLTTVGDREDKLEETRLPSGALEHHGCSAA